MSVTYTAVLDVSEDSVLFLSGLLHAERLRRGTRTGSRALSTYRQAVLVLRWLFDDTRMIQLARDNGIGVSTAYDYRDEALTVLAARKPSLHGALLAAKAAGHAHVVVDGTLIYTDRHHAPGPTAGVDLWWSGKHLPEAWIAPPATRELRGWVRHRAKLVGLRSGLSCQIHAVLAGAGVQVPMSDLFGVSGRELLAGS